MKWMRYQGGGTTDRTPIGLRSNHGRQGADPLPGISVLCAAIGVSCLVFAGEVAAEDWSRFRGPGGMGESRAAGLPTHWSEQENVIWRVDLPGPGASSPIVFGDRIYVTCYSGYLVPGQDSGQLEDLVRHVVAVGKNDGKILWQQTVPARQPEQKRIRDHGYAASTPVADRDGVVVFFGTSGVLAYSHEGRLQWEADVGSKTSGWGSSASPIVHRDLVLVNACVESGSLVALDRKTGRERWRVGNIKESWSTPLVVESSGGREELVLAAKPQILAYDPASGSPLWTCDTDIPWYMVPAVVEAGGVVFALGGRSGVAGLAVRAGGDGDVTATHRLWTSDKGSNVTSPIVHDGHLYWMHEQRGIAFCADVRSGERRYEEKIDRAGQVYASPVLAEGRIYYLNRSGTTFVVSARPEFELVAANKFNDGSQWNASPAIAGNRLLLRSDKALYCLGK